MNKYKRHREFEVHLVTYDGEQHLRLHGWLKRNDVIVKMESINKKKIHLVLLLFTLMIKC